jgi:hypothetical protein
MMRSLVVLGALVAPVVVSAQPTAPITATPLPPTVQYPPPQQQPAAPNAQPGASPSASMPQPALPAWLTQATAQLQVLDKVNAQNAVLMVKVGQSATFGSLTIQVQACQIRPPDQPQDATAYLTITDSHSDAPGFRGWMLANHPSVSMLQHPIYDVRVVGCRT